MAQCYEQHKSEMNGCSITCTVSCKIESTSNRGIIVEDSCQACGKAASDPERLHVEGQACHPSHVRCELCGSALSTDTFAKTPDSKRYCIEDHADCIMQTGKAAGVKHEQIIVNQAAEIESRLKQAKEEAKRLDAEEGKSKVEAKIFCMDADDWQSCKEIPKTVRQDGVCAAEQQTFQHDSSLDGDNSNVEQDCNFDELMYLTLDLVNVLPTDSWQRLLEILSARESKTIHLEKQNEALREEIRLLRDAVRRSERRPSSPSPSSLSFSLSLSPPPPSPPPVTDTALTVQHHGDSPWIEVKDGNLSGRDLTSWPDAATSKEKEDDVAEASEDAHERRILFAPEPSTPERKLSSFHSDQAFWSSTTLSGEQSEDTKVISEASQDFIESQILLTPKHSNSDQENSLLPPHLSALLGEVSGNPKDKTIHRALDWSPADLGTLGKARVDSQDRITCLAPESPGFAQSASLLPSDLAAQLTKVAECGCLMNES